MTNDYSLKQLVLDSFADLKLAVNSLQFAYKKCQLMGVKPHYDEQELLFIDALTSRFARVADILQQKVLKSIDLLELEASGSIRDILNRSEKRCLIDSAEKMVEIRLLRNRIAHDYAAEHLNDIYVLVLQYIPHLMDAMQRIERYLSA